MVNQSLASFRQSETKRLEVQAKAAISERFRNERMQSWTSSGSSVKEMEAPPVCSVLGFAIFSVGLGKYFLGKLKIISRRWKLLGKHKRGEDK